MALHVCILTYLKSVPLFWTTLYIRKNFFDLPLRMLEFGLGENKCIYPIVNVGVFALKKMGKVLRKQSCL